MKAMTEALKARRGARKAGIQIESRTSSADDLLSPFQALKMFGASCESRVENVVVDSMHDAHRIIWGLHAGMDGMKRSNIVTVFQTDRTSFSVVAIVDFACIYLFKIRLAAFAYRSQVPAASYQNGLDRQVLPQYCDPADRSLSLDRWPEIWGLKSDSYPSGLFADSCVCSVLSIPKLCAGASRLAPAPASPHPKPPSTHLRQRRHPWWWQMQALCYLCCLISHLLFLLQRLCTLLCSLRSGLVIVAHSGGTISVGGVWSFLMLFWAARRLRRRLTRSFVDSISTIRVRTRKLSFGPWRHWQREHPAPAKFVLTSSSAPPSPPPTNFHKTHFIPECRLRCPSNTTWR